jgi:putative membrane protein
MKVKYLLFVFYIFLKMIFLDLNYTNLILILLKFIFIIIVGFLFGTITGIFPGIHINLVAFIVLIFYQKLLFYFTIKEVVLFLIVMSLTHTFIDYLSTVLFSGVNDSSIFQLLPSQKLFLEFKTLDGINYSILGSFYGSLFFLIILPFLLLVLNIIFNFVNKYILFILILNLFFLIFLEKSFQKIFLNLIIVLISGILGIMILNSNYLRNPILILLSGLFSLPFLINNIFSKENNLSQLFRKQYMFLTKEFNFFNFSKKKNNLEEKNLFLYEKFYFEFLFVVFSSFVVSFIPTLSSSTVAFYISYLFKITEDTLKIFYVSIINSVNFISSIFVFYFFNKSRNGVINIISNFYQFSLFDLICIYFIILISIFILKKWTFYVGIKSLKYIKYVNIKNLYLFIFILVNLLVYFTNNWFGLFSLYLCTLFGLIVIKLNIKKITMMSSLIVPTIIYFL